MLGEAQSKDFVTIRVITAPLFRITRAGKVGLVSEKLPKKQVQHFMEQGGRAPGLCVGPRRWGAPKRRAEDNRIVWQGDVGSRSTASLREGDVGGAAVIGSHRPAANVWHPFAKSFGCRSETVRNQVCRLLVVRPRHRPRWITEEETKEAQGFRVARHQFGGGISRQPDGGSNRASHDWVALVRGVRRAAGRACLIAKSRRGDGGGLAETQILPKMNV